MVGFLIGFWATPHMTGGHLLLAGLITAYVMFGTRVEERDLLAMLGEDYRAYRARDAGVRATAPIRVHVRADDRTSN